MSSRSRRPSSCRRALAPLAASLLALGAASAGPAAASVAAADATCDLATTTFSVDATPDSALTTEFNRYADGRQKWNGGDSTYSATLPDGRQAWFFSDTLIGGVEDDGSQAIEKFVNSSILVQDGSRIVKTVTGGSSANPTGLIPPDADGWYWLGANTLTDDGSSLDVVFLRFERFGPGPWDWRWSRNVLGRLDPTSLKVRKVVALPSASGVNWGSWIQRQGDHTLIYGVEDLGLAKYMRIARVAGDDLTGPWTFWDGTGWSADELASVRIMPGVANEYSVTPFRDGYLLVTHDTNELFSRNIVGYTSCSPTGPFAPIGTLYATPETGLFGSYGNPNIITYNSHEHPELRADGTLLVTYNVNSLDSADLYRDATIYRPRFVRVELEPST